jgi:CHAT domain
LTLVDVARLRLDGAGLAFLSAWRRHFQPADYRHVIAALWPVGDQHAVDLTADIYTTLTSVGAGDVAGAVHAAVRRTQGTLSRWASHMHTGA